MRLRLFRAARMSDAMAQLRAELGPDAVILSTRRVADGVEVSAGLESAEPLLILPGAMDSERPDPLQRNNVPPGLLALLSVLPLADALAEHLDFAPLPENGARPLLLCGPPGVGKTLSCAKLAARGVLAGTAPLVVTTDSARAGAIEQLAAFTRVLGITLAVAPGPGTLGKALVRRAHGQPVLIDTAGIDPSDAAQAADLRALIEAAGATPVLVLSAGLDAADAADLATGFRDLGALHLLPTKLDLPRRLGSVLAAAAAGLALTEAGIGPDAAHGLAPITPAWLAERLLTGPPERHA